MQAVTNIIVVTGPTASGKTSLSIELAQRLGGEIINADSVQVYKGFNIGSAKASPEELAKVPHHLLSVVEPSDDFNSEKFCKLAQSAIAEISARGKVPIVCGGTGLYLRSLLCGMIEMDEVSVSLKEELEAEIAELGLPEADLSKHLHAELAKQDQASATAIHPNDIQRVKRALLVYRMTGESFLELQDAHSHGRPQYRAMVIVASPERELLNRRINARVISMIGEGLLDEVSSLSESYPLSARPFGAIGYRHALQHLQDRISFDKMVETLKRDTRRFAKRQRTWWRNQPRFLGWTNVGTISSIAESLGSNSSGDVVETSNRFEVLFTLVADFFMGSRMNDLCEIPSDDINRIFFVEYDGL